MDKVTELFSVVSNMRWIKTENEYPEQGVEVLGFHETWINEDCNTDGICVCFFNGTDWYISIWCNHCDKWHMKCTDESNNKENYSKILAPSYWTVKPAKPIM